jgi:hypothetical protein
MKLTHVWSRSSVVDVGLRYKPKGRGSRHNEVTDLSVYLILMFTQPLTQMSNRRREKSFW